MKKLLVCLLVLSLTACSTPGKMDISNPDDVVFTFGDETITKEQIYKSLYANVGLNAIVEESFKIICTLENTSLTIEQLKDNELFNEELTKVIHKYFDIDFDTYVSTLTPKQVEYIYFADEKIANQAHAAVLDGSKDFVTIANENQFYGNYFPQVVTNTTALPYVVKDAILKSTNKELLPLLFDEEKGNYYIVNVLNTDVNEFKDDFYASLSQSQEYVINAYKYYFDKYDLTFYSEKVQEDMKNSLSWIFE